MMEIFYVKFMCIGKKKEVIYDIFLTNYAYFDVMVRVLHNNKNYTLFYNF